LGARGKKCDAVEDYVAVVFAPGGHEEEMDLRKLSGYLRGIERAMVTLFIHKLQLYL